MSNIIDSIRLSGVTYTLSAETSGGNNVVELTQAQYDALVDKDPTAFYIITDAQPLDISEYWTSAQTQSAITESVSGKQDTLVSGTNIKTINNESLLGSGNIDIQGGGKAIEAGRGISVTTGETADTVSFNLPISASTVGSSVIGGNSNTVEQSSSIAYGSSNTIKNSAYGNSVAFGKSNIVGGNSCFVCGQNNSSNNTSFGVHIEGENNTTYSGTRCAHIEGGYNVVGGSTSYAHSEGFRTSATTNYSHTEGQYTITRNTNEHASGKYNASNTGSTDADKTLFSVGNGTSTSARHNAFEIRQNGDIYLTKDGQDVKLQDQLGGSDINVVQTTGTSTTDVMSQNAVSTKLSDYVTIGTEQTISGRKVFTYSSSTNKAIEFKQTSDTAKVGFMIKNSAATNNELASFEFRPNTFTIDNVQHPLMYFGHYRNTNTANAGVPQTVIGFRQYDQLNNAAYHYLMPLPEKAKTPFSLTTTFKDYYAPIGFKNGSTMITTDNTGVADFSSELGGLKLVKLTQSAYDALSPNYDSNTLYVIVN